VLLVGFEITLEGSEDASAELQVLNSLQVSTEACNPGETTSEDVLGAVRDVEFGGEVKVVLSMTEPDPMNTSVWIKWFDELGTSSEVLKRALSQVR
jgi:hypothetical protein